MDTQAIERLKSLVLPNIRESIRLALSRFTEMLDELGLEFDRESKRYLGHLVAQVLKAKIGLTLTGEGDVIFEGVPVEIKHTIGDSWMIAPENVDRYALLIKTNLRERTFGIGLLHLTSDKLNKGKNRDDKVSISAEGKTHIQWWCENEFIS